MEIFLQLLVSGATYGMVYATVAYGYQLTFATSSTLNFGQGEAVTLGSLVGLSLASVTGYWLMLPVVLAFGFVQGGIVERLGVRQAIHNRSESGWIMATIALGIIFRNLAENIWGRDALPFPSPVSSLPLEFGVVRILPMQILIVVGAIGLMLAVEAFNRFSIYGKAVIATSNDRDAAGLMGIDTRQVIAFSYGLSSAAAAFAGVLVAPVVLTGPNMGGALGLKAFAVAIIGGLSSGIGPLVGGLIIGLSDVMTGFYVSTGYKDVPGLLLLLFLLAVKPAGLFGKTAIRKV